MRNEALSLRSARQQKLNDLPRARTRALCMYADLKMSEEKNTVHHEKNQRGCLVPRNLKYVPSLEST